MAVNNDREAIARWQRMLARYSDENYFFLVRNYLGPVGTPFHKPTLTARLTNFFLNDLNQERIVALIDDDDAMILTAVHLMRTPCENDILDLFRDDYPYAELQRRIVNLEERLLLLPAEDRKGLSAVAVNPLLETRLEKEIFSLTSLFCGESSDRERHPSPALVTENILRGYLNLIVQGQVSDSAAMEARLYASAPMEGMFPTIEPDRVPKLFAMLRKLLEFLQVVAASPDGRHTVSRRSCAALLNLNDRAVTLLLLSAAFTRIVRNANGNADLTSTYGSCGRLAVDFLALANALPPFSRKSYDRLMRILARRNGLSFSVEIADGFLDALLVLGIMDNVSDSGADMGYQVTETARRLFLQNDDEQLTSPLTVDSDCTVSYSGSRRNSCGTSEDLLYLIGEVRQVDVLCRYEITRQSFRHALDYGLSFEEIAGYLEKASANRLPTHLVQMMGEWYAAYHSVRIYDGIVVCCDTRMTRIIDQHPQLQPYIVQRIQEGVYLFSRREEARWRLLLQTAGADMLPKTIQEEMWRTRPNAARLSANVRQQDEIEETGLSLLMIMEQAPQTLNGTRAPASGFSLTAKRLEPWTRPRFLEEIAQAIDRLHLDGTDAEEMDSRFRSSLLLVPQQVVRQRLYTGLLSASGFDFRGKLNLCKSAVGKDDMILEVRIYDNDEEKNILLQAKELMYPTSQDAMLRGIVLPTMEERTIPVSRMFLVKRQRLSLLGGHYCEENRNLHHSIS